MTAPAEQPASSTSASPAATATTGGVVARNTLYLTLSQVITIPVSVLLNAMLARYLGAVEFGFLYLAGTMAGFGYLVVEWGHGGALPALVARDHAGAGRLLGSSIAWRIVLSVVVYAALALASHLLGYTTDFQWALGLTFLCATLNSLGAAYKDTIRGFERTDIPAVAHVAQQLLSALLVVPVLLLGGRMRAALVVSAVAIVLTLIFLARKLGPVGVGKLRVERGALKALLTQGAPFVLMGLAMAAQPNVDALYLAEFAPPEVMGWFGAAQRLVGVLLLPVSSLIGALYPTLSRLHDSDAMGFRDAARSALHGVSLIVFPVALGCGLFPDIGITVFSREQFGPAEQNLRIMAVFLFLVYFSMPLGTTLMAAGKQRAWSIVQAGSVLLYLILDPLFIPWFQRRYGNGGLGVCTSAVVAEVVIVVAGIVLLPKGVLDRRLLRSLLLAGVAGGAMAGVALLLRGVNSFIVAPLAVFAYAGALVITGAVGKAELAAAWGTIMRKLKRSSA